MMIDLSTTCKHRAAKIHFSWEFRSELEWWHHMAALWNDTYMLASDPQEKNTQTLQMHLVAGGMGPRSPSLDIIPSKSQAAGTLLQRG